MSADFDVAIIGGGVSGLAAADRLIRAGRKVVVLEARDRVGGRTLLGAVAGTPIDLGGQWVGAAHRRLVSLIDELQLKLFPQHYTGYHSFELGPHLHRYQRQPFLGLIATPRIIRIMLATERAAAQMNVVDPMAHPNAIWLDRITFAEWVRRIDSSRTVQDFMGMIVRAVFSAEAWEVSALHALTYFASSGGLVATTEVRNAAQQDRVFGGLGEVARRLAARLPPGSVRLEAPVCGVHQEAGLATLAYGTGPAATLTARRVISAAPPALVADIVFAPALPTARLSAIAHIPMGAVVKAFLAYPTPFWRNAGLSGAFASIADPFGPIFDASVPGSDVGLLVGFFEGDAARDPALAAAADRRAAAIATAVKAFGAQAAHPIDYVEQDWVSERWSRGCYGGLFGPGVWSALSKTLRTPHGLVHWAGTEAARVAIGYVEGAIESGWRAAEEAHAALA